MYGIVHDVPYPIIYSWAICKPCQVVPLVDILVNALAYSNIALDLVTIFGKFIIVSIYGSPGKS